MIRYTTRIQDNKFYVKFDLSPQDVKCSRGNYTAIHKGAGTTSRNGIWEGVELVKVYGRVNSDNPWVDLGKNTKPEIYTDKNGNTIQLKATYRIKTMGYHWQCTNGSLPFFYYGNIGGNPNKYSNGYFTDGSPSTPKENLHSIHAVVPKDWRYVSSAWSDWAYIHAKNTSNWAIDNGRYEQRNGNTEAATSSNGWISDSGYKQTWRKSCLFTFEKEFSISIPSSGIVTDASVPKLAVEAVKGDSGKVTLTYVDKYNCKGRLWLRAYCNGKQVDLLTYDNSPEFSNGNTKTITVDFIKTFGESYRGNDITYEAWAKNNYDKESASTGKKGGHRFNGRPTVPNGLFVTGKNDIIYNDITFSWNASQDPDDDSLVYDLQLMVISANGTKLRDSVIATGVKTLSYNYSIINDPDNCRYTLWVRASDGLITSDWSRPLEFTKGARPTGNIALICPEVDKSVLYSTRPRFAFKGYDGESTFVVNFNNKEYNNIDNSELFTIQDDKIMFCIKNDSSTIKIHAYMKNEYGTSDKSDVYNFTVKSAKDEINEGQMSTAFIINNLANIIEDKGKAFKINVGITDLIAKESYIKASNYNECVEVLKAINDKLNNIVNTSKFDVSLIAEEIRPGQINDDLLWKNLIKDIENI